MRKTYLFLKEMFLRDFPDHPVVAAFFFGTIGLMMATSFMIIIFALVMALLRKAGVI